MSTPFTGFGPDLFAFLKGLKANNHKEWFDKHRGDYEDSVKAPLGDLVETLAVQFAKAKLELKGDRKASLFRMNKDIRFSKDKTPYKVNAAAVMSRNGTKKQPEIFYLHFEPGASFLAAGFYMPEPPVLLALRTAVVDAPAKFRKLVAALKKHDLAFDRDDALTRPPKGFADVTEPDLLDAVKMKHFVVSLKLTDTEVLSADLVKTAVAFAKATWPLLEFGAEALKVL